MLLSVMNLGDRERRVSLPSVLENGRLYTETPIVQTGAPAAGILDASPSLQKESINTPPVSATPLKQKNVKKFRCQGHRDTKQCPTEESPSSALPPRSPLSTRRPRSASEDGSFCFQRRPIFGNYWKGVVRPPVHPRSPRRFPQPEIEKRQDGRRESTHSTTASLATGETEAIDYRMYAPPENHAARSGICSRFESVNAVPALDSLPPLPSPLRRLCSDESATRSMHGMYPIGVNPVSILRQSSYRSFFDSPKMLTPPPTPPPRSFRETFNLTKSVGPHEKPPALDLESSSSVSSSSKSTELRFDPRVTVTEYEDPYDRIWYSEVELERLKQETVLLAQDYLITHPEEAAKYNQMRLDPITNTYRKKALFSLPVLSSVVEGVLPAPHHREYQTLLENQVQKVLIVDPNSAILSLFCKSMNSMFPRATLFTAQSAEEALTLVDDQLVRETKDRPRNFDLIIVEQRLFQPNMPQLLPTHNHQNSMPASSMLENISEMGPTPDFREFPFLRKPNSFYGAASAKSSANPAFNSGSDLFRAIIQMESSLLVSRCRAQDSSSASGPAISLLSDDSIEWCALLIGVSIQPDRDAKVLKDAGADLIWGKPIPRIGEALRNQLLGALISKRRRLLLAADDSN